MTMTKTIGGAPPHANGDALATSATGQGGPMGLLDAAYHTAHNFPGGVPALAQRMGMSGNTLQHKLNLRNSTHQLMLREASAMMAITGDLQLLHALAAEHDCVVMSQAQASEQVPPVTRVLSLVREFSDTLAAVNQALEDGRVTLNELHTCEREIGELQSAAQAMLATLRGLVPPDPSVLPFPRVG